MLVGLGVALPCPVDACDDDEPIFAFEKNLVKLVALPIPGRTADPMAGVDAALLGPPGLMTLAVPGCDRALRTETDVELFALLCPGRMVDCIRGSADRGVFGRMYD
jgi:hypothetical protein